MTWSHSILRIAAAGLPADAVDEIYGELSRFDTPHRSGIPFSDRELLPVALWESIRARCSPRTWSHLPAVAPLAFAMMAVGSGIIASASLRRPTGMTEAYTYVPILLSDLLAVLSFGARSVPVKRVAVVSAILTVGVVAQITFVSRPTLLEMLLDRVGVGIAAVLPLAWVALAVRYRERGLGWDELPAAVRSGRLTSWAWRAMTVVMLAFGLRNLAFLPGHTSSLLLAGASLANIAGLLLAGLAFAAVGRRPAIA